MEKQAFRLALTGGIASGKSLVGKFLTDQGIPVIDADDVVHDLLKNDNGLKQCIASYFGSSVLDSEGNIQRKVLGQQVFSDVNHKKMLESWIHPKTRAVLTSFYEQHKASHTLVVSIIPLLFESNLQGLYDGVWLIDVPVETQIARMVQTRGLTRKEALDRINAQMSAEEKKQKLLHCLRYCLIDNSQMPENLIARVKGCLFSLEGVEGQCQ